MANAHSFIGREKSQKLEHIGSYIIRYGLAVVLIWIGILKFTLYEAEGIRPLAENSPFYHGYTQ